MSCGICLDRPRGCNALRKKAAVVFLRGQLPTHHVYSVFQKLSLSWSLQKSGREKPRSERAPWSEAMDASAITSETDDWWSKASPSTTLRQSVNSQNTDIILEGGTESIWIIVWECLQLQLNGDSEAKYSWFVGTEKAHHSSCIPDPVDRDLYLFSVASTVLNTSSGLLNVCYYYFRSFTKK